MRISFLFSVLLCCILFAIFVPTSSFISSCDCCFQFRLRCCFSLHVIVYIILRQFIYSVELRSALFYLALIGFPLTLMLNFVLS